jgi:hypothetical protein
MRRRPILSGSKPGCHPSPLVLGDGLQPQIAWPMMSSHEPSPSASPMIAQTTNGIQFWDNPITGSDCPPPNPKAGGASRKSLKSPEYTRLVAMLVAARKAADVRSWPTSWPRVCDAAQWTHLRNLRPYHDGDRPTVSVVFPRGGIPHIAGCLPLERPEPFENIVLFESAPNTLINRLNFISSGQS